MIERQAEYYTTAYEGKDAFKAPFYLRAREAFDGTQGDLNAELIECYNRHLRNSERFRDVKLKLKRSDKGELPGRIVIINASGDDLPTSYETGRVFAELLSEKGLKIPIDVVNTSEELSSFLSSPDKILFVSQCVKKEVYDIALAREIATRGGVVVPGEVTAPGGVFSDKSATYELLSDGSKNWDMVARYEKVSFAEKSTGEVASGIMDAVDRMAALTGDDKFFIKPCEGGGGLGGFRISKHENGYYIPDLSKVTGRPDGVHPTYIDLDVEDDAKLRELVHIYRLFRSDPVMSRNYIGVELPLDPEGDLEPVRDYLSGSRELRRKKVENMLLSRSAARERIKRAIDEFEAKFGRRYSPLVNEHIDFGLWGLRAHYRISSEGVLLETMYHRIFQLAFTPEGVGYLGSDNISNKQTGDLEIMRLGPIEKVMLEAIGGQEALFRTLDKGALATVKLRDLAPKDLADKIPVRSQLDLAAVSEKIGEGNADTARGLCLASRWQHFVLNARDWLEDGLAYYACRKSGKGL